MALNLQVDVDAVMARREGVDSGSQTVKVSGLISTAAWGQGRSSADRQFYYINGRPCDLKQVAKTVNEVYKSFNTHQFPMVVMDFKLPPESIDINVSPDKRTIFLHSEANLLEALRLALETFFAPSRSAYALEGASKAVKMVDIQSQLPYTNSQRPEDAMRELPDAGDEADQDQSVEENDAVLETSKAANAPPKDMQSNGDSIVFETEIDATPPSKSSLVTRFTLPPSSEASSSRNRAHQVLNTSSASWSPERKRQKLRGGLDNSSQGSLRSRLAEFASQGPPIPATMDDEENTEERREDEDRETRSVSVGSGEAADQSLDKLSDDPTDVDEEGEDELLSDSCDHDADRVLNGAAASPPLDARVRSPAASSRLPNRTMIRPDPIDIQAEHEPIAGPSRPISHDHSGYRDEISSTAPQGEMTLRFDLPRLRKRYRSARQGTSTSSSTQRSAFDALADGSVANAAGIQNRDSLQAEEALARVISKAAFERMEILGQFNKGFIIARLRPEARATGSTAKKKASDDLFIIDQHACDEKYNFETLQQTTVIKGQTLIK